MIESLIAYPSKYSKELFTNKTFYEADIWGGRGRGGSHNMTLYALLEIMKPQYFRGFLVRAIQKDVRESLWQDFKDRIEELSEVNHYDFKKDFHLIDNEMKAIYMPNGNTLKSKGFRSASKSQTANMKSIAGATHVFIEETEEVGRMEYNKLADSLRTIKAPVKIIRSWNAPPKSHWLVKDYFNLIKSEEEGYFTLKPKGIKNHLSLFGTFRDNIKNLDENTIARYIRYKETTPKYYFNQILGLVSSGGDSKVYYNWTPISTKDFDELDAVEGYGLDFGDTAQTGLVHIKYKDGAFYRKQLLYKSLRALNIEYGDKIKTVRENISKFATNTQFSIWDKHKGLISYVFDLMKVDKKIKMFCDPAQKSLVTELRLAGYNAIIAKKDKSANINFINRAVNYYTEDSTDMENEYENYYLEVDINKDPIDGKPKKGIDHLMDAQEYGCRGLKDFYKIIL